MSRGVGTAGIHCAHLESWFERKVSQWGKNSKETQRHHAGRHRKGSLARLVPRVWLRNQSLVLGVTGGTMFLSGSMS